MNVCSIFMKMHLNQRKDNKKKQEETTKERFGKPVTERFEHHTTRKAVD